MPAPLSLPKRFTTGDSLKLKDELERMSTEIDTYLRNLEQRIESTPAIGKLNNTFASFGQILPVSARDGETVVVQLPAPDPKSIGKKCGILRLTNVGEVLIYAVGCFVAGHERYRMANDVHLVEFRFYNDYYPLRAGGGF